MAASCSTPSYLLAPGLRRAWHSRWRSRRSRERRARSRVHLSVVFALFVVNWSHVARFALLFCLSSWSTAHANFVEVASDVGIVYQQGAPSDPTVTSELLGMTGGAAAGDYDNDGWVDLFVTRTNASDLLYRNQNGTFVDVTAAAFGTNPLDATTNGAAWGDIDNDGDLDLYVTTLGTTGHLLYVNQGDGAFVEAAAARGAAIGGAELPVYGTSPAWGDYDRDGYLDLYVGEWRLPGGDGSAGGRLLRNRGAAAPGHFVDVTAETNVALDLSSGPLAGSSYSFTPRFADFDGDRWPDLAVTSDFGTSRLFWNEGASGHFSDGTASTGIATGLNDMGSAIGDVTGDGRPDWFITDIYRDPLPNSHPNGNRLFRNDGNRQFTDITDQAGVRDGDWGWGAVMFDYDNDGDLDITMTNGFIDGDQYLSDPMRLWENDGSGAFVEIGETAGVDDSGQGRGMLHFDYDRDGDLDLFVVNHGQSPVLLRNDAEAIGDFLRIKTIGRHSNRDGVGAVVTVTPDVANRGHALVWEISGGTNYLAQSETTAHFGLGAGVVTVDEVKILWPSGLQQLLFDVPAGSELYVEELAGDFDSSGVTDAADLEAWQTGYGLTGTAAVLATGDSDATARVDGQDLLWWQRGIHAPSPHARPIPEPSPAVLLMMGLVLGGKRFFKKKGSGLFSRSGWGEERGQDFFMWSPVTSVLWREYRP